MKDTPKRRTKDNSAPRKGKRHIREDLHMSTLSDRERKAYEECLALLQGLSEEGTGSLEEACEVLQRFAATDKDKKTEG